MPEARNQVGIRRPVTSDAPELGEVIYRAFDAVAHEFSYRPNFPDARAGIREAQRLLASRRYFGYVATDAHEVVGGAFGMHGNDVAGVGPIIVRPDVQGRGVGRQLMRALMADIRRRGYSRARLQQDAANVRSMTLYATEGFDFVDTSAILEAPADRSVSVSAAPPTDRVLVAALCRRIYGIDRDMEIGDAILEGRLLVHRVGEEIDGYLIPTVFGHGTAANPPIALRLALHAAWLAHRPLRFLVLLRQTDLYRHAIEAGCRPVKVMNLMSWGPYIPPGSYSLPSISF